MATLRYPGRRQGPGMSIPDAPTSGHFGFSNRLRRALLVAGCLLIAVCFMLGSDYYRASVMVRQGEGLLSTDKYHYQSAAPAKSNKTLPMTVDVAEAMAQRSSKLSWRSRLSRSKFGLPVMRRWSDGGNSPNAGGDLCGSPATPVTTFPFNDSGTTVGAVDDYNLAPDATDPTLTGCPSCSAAGSPVGRGFSYTGTGVGPDVAYRLTLGQSFLGTLTVTMDPTGAQDMALIVYTNVCSNNLTDAIVIDDTGGGGVAESVTIGNMPPGTYNFVVDGYSTGGTPPGPSGAYTLNITANAAVPTAADGRVNGRITDPNGAGLAGAVVNLSGTQNRKFITDANGNYHFENVETNGFYSVTPSMPGYHFSPETRSFSQIGNSTDAAFTAAHDPVGGANRIDTPEYFVRQNYLDFLGREPDESGFNFWSDQILSCGADAGCSERRTINVSAAYFLSIEFAETGGLVDGLYRASYNRRPLYDEFIPDTRTVAQDVVVGNAGWAQRLAANKQAFVEAWVQRSEFRAAYDGLTNNGYVDRLISHTGVSFSQSERDALVSGLNSSTSTRADVLSQIAENEQFVSAKRNETFVMMEYFGYLRRDPDESGYQFWLNKLNQFGGNFEQAEMVKAFINSGEYRQRFGQ